MVLIGARLTIVEPGYTEVTLAYRDDLTQQKAYIHGGILGMIADSACGYAAYSLMPASASLVTVEYKINILAPAKTDLVARGHLRNRQDRLRCIDLELALREHAALQRAIGIRDRDVDGDGARAFHRRRVDALHFAGEFALAETADLEPGRLAAVH